MTVFLALLLCIHGNLSVYISRSQGLKGCSSPTKRRITKWRRTSRTTEAETGGCCRLRAKTCEVAASTAFWWASACLHVLASARGPDRGWLISAATRRPAQQRAVPVKAERSEAAELKGQPAPIRSSELTSSFRDSERRQAENLCLPLEVGSSHSWVELSLSAVNGARSVTSAGSEVFPFVLINQLEILWHSSPSSCIIQSFVRKCQSFNKPPNSPSQHGLHHWHFAGS